MKTNRNRTAKLFAIAHVGEAEVQEGANTALAIGIDGYGATVGIVENFAAPSLEIIREQIDERGYAAIVTLTGEAITDPEALSFLSRMAGREINFALRGIHSMRYIDGDENKVAVKVSRRGNLQRTQVIPRQGAELNRRFTCMACRNAGRKPDQTAREEDMETVETRGGRTMTIAPCPACDAIMTRTGGKTSRKELHAGLGELKLVFEAPEFAYCPSCHQKVRRIWLKSIRKTDTQPRPSYRGNCFRCLGMVASPWQQTRLVPIKRQTIERVVAAATAAEDTIYAERMAEAREMHRVARENAMAQAAMEREREQEKMADALVALRERYKVA